MGRPARDQGLDLGLADGGRRQPEQGVAERARPRAPPLPDLAKAQGTLRDLCYPSAPAQGVGLEGLSGEPVRRYARTEHEGVLDRHRGPLPHIWSEGVGGVAQEGNSACGEGVAR